MEALKGYTVVVSGSGFAVEKGGYTSGTATDGYNVWIVTWTAGEGDVDEDGALTAAVKAQVGVVIE